MGLIVSGKKNREKRLVSGKLPGAGLLILLLVCSLFQAKADWGSGKAPLNEKVNLTEGVSGYFKVVTGKVIDQDGNPVAGATVSVNGAASGITTADDGTFSINANEGDELMVSHISFLPATVKVGQANQITVALQLNINKPERQQLCKRGRDQPCTREHCGSNIAGTCARLERSLRFRSAGAERIGSD